MRSSTIGFTIVSMCVGIILFKVKYEVVALENKHTSVKKSIHDVKESIHVLKAEWAHLTDPERIQNLTVKYINNGKPLSIRNAVQNKIQTKNNEKNISSLSNTNAIDKIQKNDIKPPKNALDLLIDEADTKTSNQISFKKEIAS